MYQSSVYSPSVPQHPNAHEPRRINPVPAFFHISGPNLSDSDPSKSPFYIGSIPVPSTPPPSLPSPRSPTSPSRLQKRDVGTDTNIANLVMAGVIGAFTITLQERGNWIAARALQLTSDEVVRRVQDSGVAQAGTNTVGGGITSVQTASKWLPSIPSLRFSLPNLNPFRGKESRFPDHVIRRFSNDTLELSRNLDGGLVEKVAVIDESRFPELEGLAHDDLVEKIIEITAGMFEVGSDTETVRTGGDVDLEEQDIPAASIEYVGIIDHWADDGDEESNN